MNLRQEIKAFADARLNLIYAVFLFPFDNCVLSQLIITGTGTDVGKTLLSGLVMSKYAEVNRLSYHKPVQTGMTSDRETVQQLSGLPDTFFMPELYSFPEPASPHFAAEQAGSNIDVSFLKDRLRAVPAGSVIELAGGIVVPLTRYYTNLNLMQDLGFPAVLVASTGLGTINHSVLSLNTLRAAGIRCLGIFFVGRENRLREDNIRTICDMTETPNLGCLLLDEENMPPEVLRPYLRDFVPPENLQRLFL